MLFMVSSVFEENLLLMTLPFKRPRQILG